MKDIGDLGQKFIRTRPSSMGEILEAERDCGRSFPQSYKKFLLRSNGGEGPIGRNGYIVLWPVGSIAKKREKSGFATFLPDLIPIGSNGGGEALALQFAGNSAWFGYVPWVDLNTASFIRIADDFWLALEKIGEGTAFDT